MASSQQHQIPKIISIVKIANPASVLDVGMGFGKYGMLCREYLELWGEIPYYHNFQRRIDGIETSDEFITKLHDYVYDNVYIGKAQDIVNKLNISYDLVLLIDVLEHLEKQDGIKLVSMLLKNNNGLLISIPKFMGIHPDHKSEWSKKELSQLNPSFFVKDDSNFIFYFGHQKIIDKLINTNKNDRRRVFKTNLMRTIGKIPFVKKIYSKINNHQKHF